MSDDNNLDLDYIKRQQLPPNYVDKSTDKALKNNVGVGNGVDNSHNVQQTATQTNTEDDERRQYYNELMQVLKSQRKQYAPESEEDKVKRVKRERARAIINAVGDGVSALSSIVSATRGAAPTYDANNSLSERWQNAYDKRVAERKANEQQYLNYTQQMANLAANQAQWRRQLDADKAVAAKQADKDARENFIAQARAELYKAQAEGNLAKAEKLREEIDNATYMRPYNKALVEAKTSKLKSDVALNGSKQATEATKQTKNIAQAKKNGSIDTDYVTDTYTDVPIVDPITGKPTGEVKTTKSTSIKRKVAKGGKYHNTDALFK